MIKIDSSCIVTRSIRTRKVHLSELRLDLIDLAAQILDILR